LEKFLQQSPNDCFLHHALALEFVKQNNREKALYHFTANLNFDKNYVATYYHLAALYKKMENEPKDIETYEQGMEIAKAIGDQHSFSELRSAYEELIY